ncbi:MAG TPA: CoA transferase [Candidatus Binatia bacterium]
MAGALAGIKVIEAASYVTGPFASQLLADMGAEVIKIEEPKRVIRFVVGEKKIMPQHFAV